MKKDITLKDIAGYTTERTVWQLMLNLSEGCDQGRVKDITPEKIAVCNKGFQLINGESAVTSKAFAAPETFDCHAVGGLPANHEASSVWIIGALSFYAVMGTDVFEGRGGETQTEQTDIPRISSAHASQELSSLIRLCLDYSPERRPSLVEIQQQAQKALSAPIVPRKRLTSQTGKSYARSLVKFWPEEMVSVIILLLLIPLGISAQTPQKFDKATIPNELATLVMRCIDLRSPQNAAKVNKAMDRDMNWTMMDELAVDKNGECTTKEMVDMFGLNDMGFSILKRHGGVTNAGGRFRDGRDPRYKYSLIEITVKKDKAVSYPISGREGTQLFAIVPYEEDGAYETFITPKGGKQVKGEIIEGTKDGVKYILLKQGIKKNDSFTLTVINKSGKNMAFSLINFNSRNYE